MLRHPAVRDLAGVVGAPNLLTRPELISDAECLGALESRQAWFEELDRNPAPLVEALQATTRSHRLGHYFEALLGFWIRFGLQASRLEVGLKVRRHLDTVGELDFVFERVGRVEHWEAAVKFYLCTAESGATVGTQDFLGPMGKDRLDLKISKLFDHQLALPARPEARATLEAQGFLGPIRSRAIVKGALFYPVRSDWRAHPHPTEVSPGHSRGWWSRGFDAGAFPADSRWVELPRLRWLSPFIGEGSPITHSGMRDYCRSHFEMERRALMLARVRREGDLWVEIDRGVVVHSDWPM